ncbi:4-hydroxyphenylpyruvate dioxygenase family protein [Flavitalea flava]
MKNSFLSGYDIDYVEIYTPMAKVLAYWHSQALGFKVSAYADIDTGKPGLSSFVLDSNEIRLVLTSSYPMEQGTANIEVSSFISKNYCGVKRFALRVESVRDVFEKSIAGGAFPIKFPAVVEDESGYVEEAAIKLYDNNEIVFIDRRNYKGVFKPGYKMGKTAGFTGETPLFTSIDHIASEVRINESNYWTGYLTSAIGTSLVQSIQSGAENKTGMLLNINQSADKKLTLVIAEPETYLTRSKVQKNIETYGPGIHHLAFSTPDLKATIEKLKVAKVEFVNFPSSYYDLLRENAEFKDIDIDSLQANGILIDKEDDTYLMQKFIKPISDRPFFFYEIVQRVNGYNGFALKNINVLKRAEEIEIMKPEKY